MRTLLALFTLIFTLSAFAIDLQNIDLLLRAKNLSLKQIEARDLKVLMGEVTGHAPFSKVQIVIVQGEAILRSEMEAVEFKKGASQIVANVDLLRYNGRFVTGQDIQGVIVSK